MWVLVWICVNVGYRPLIVELWQSEEEKGGFGSILSSGALLIILPSSLFLCLLFFLLYQHYSTFSNFSSLSSLSMSLLFDLLWFWCLDRTMSSKVVDLKVRPMGSQGYSIAFLKKCWIFIVIYQNQNQLYWPSMCTHTRNLTMQV